MYNKLQAVSQLKGDTTKLLINEFKGQYQEIYAEYEKYVIDQISRVKAMCKQLNLSKAETEKHINNTQAYYEPLSNADLKLEQARKEGKEAEPFSHDIYILEECIQPVEPEEADRVGRVDPLEDYSDIEGTEIDTDNEASIFL